MTTTYIGCYHQNSHGRNCTANADVILNMTLYNLDGTEDHHIKDLCICRTCAGEMFAEYARRLGAKKHIMVDIRPIDGPQPEEKKRRAQ